MLRAVAARMYSWPLGRRQFWRDDEYRNRKLRRRWRQVCQPISLVGFLDDLMTAPNAKQD